MPGLVYSELLKAHKICEEGLDSSDDSADESEREKMVKFSKPKLIRLMDILRQYKPEHVNKYGGQSKPPPPPKKSSGKESNLPPTTEDEGLGEEIRDSGQIEELASDLKHNLDLSATPEPGMDCSEDADIAATPEPTHNAEESLVVNSDKSSAEVESALQDTIASKTAKQEVSDGSLGKCVETPEPGMECSEDRFTAASPEPTAKAGEIMDVKSETKPIEQTTEVENACQDPGPTDSKTPKPEGKFAKGSSSGKSRQARPSPAEGGRTQRPYHHRRNYGSRKFTRSGHYHDFFHLSL